MIKCIISDLGGVMLKLDPGRACRKLAKIPYKLEYGEMGWFTPERTHKLMDSGKITRRQVYELLIKNLALKGLTQRQFEEAFGNVFTNNLPVQRIMKKLSEKYSMALLSNTNPIHFDYVRKNFTIIRIFSYKILSYKEGFVKPQKQIFKIALKKLRRKPSECIFVDDKLANVTAARKMGINAIQYKTAPKLRSELRKLGAEI